MKISLALFSLSFLLTITPLIGNDNGGYISPSAIVTDEKGENLFISEFDAKKVVVYNTAVNEFVAEYVLKESPSGIAYHGDENKLFVTAGSDKGKIYIIDLTKNYIEEIIDAGHTPNSPVLGKGGRFLYVNNRFDNDISVIDLRSKNEIVRINVLREPVASAITRNGKYLFVANLLPAGRADQGFISSAISVIDLPSLKLKKNIQLSNGSNAVNGITISPDGKYVYAVNILARYLMPTTQLERGWMNTNALSIISVNDLSLVNTVLLDDIDLGAANPWDVECTGDGKYLCVSHSGTHEISIINREALHKKLNAAEAGYKVASRVIKQEDVQNDLVFLDGMRRRVSLTGLGPRDITIAGKNVYAAEYFSGSIGVVDVDDKYQNKTYSISLGEEKELSAIRRGESLFYDASYCFQQWQSCVSCHPGNGRSDGLNWDLLNDGIGNSKNTRSLLLSHRTPPVMMTGVRDDAETAVRAGIKYIEFAELPETDAETIDEYLKSLEPVKSPFLIDGKLSESARRGEEIFVRADCINCHSGPLFTNLKKYNVGTDVRREIDSEFDTPTIIENWRTAPYLHDGRAATMKEVLTIFNPEDKHGITSNLSSEEIDDLVEFILSQ